MLICLHIFLEKIAYLSMNIPVCVFKFHAQPHTLAPAGEMLQADWPSPPAAATITTPCLRVSAHTGSNWVSV